MNHTINKINLKTSGFCFAIFCYLFFLSAITYKANGQAGTGPIVINEVGIGAPCLNPFLGDCDDSGGGGEFIELFNKSGCDQNIGCYVLVYSGANGVGWSVTLPNVTLAPGGYYLIAGHNSSKLFTSSWTNGTLTNTTTWKNNYSSYGNDIANLDLGRANTSGKGMIIGNLINTEGQITLFKPDKFVASSIVYNTETSSGSYPGSYPATFNSTTGCSFTGVTDPPAATVTFYKTTRFNSSNAGLTLNASDKYEVGYNTSLSPTLTPGKPNASQLANSPPPTITIQPVSQTDCKGNTVKFSSGFSASGTVTYQWQSSIDGITWSDISAFWPNISGASGSTATPITLNVGNIGVGGSNGVNTNGTQYRVIVTDLYGCKATSNAATLFVNSITAISGNVTTTVCEGQSVSYTVTTSPASTTPAITYQWIKHLSSGSWVDVPGATSQTLSFNNITLADAGEYTVRVIFPASASSGTCTETNYNITRFLVVNPLPTVAVTNNSPICSGSDAVFTLTGSSGAVVTYNINGGVNKTATLTGGTATIIVSGATTNQTLNLVSINNPSTTCSQTLSGSSTITVNSKPSPTITHN